MTLKVPFEETVKLIEAINHATCTNAIPRYWKPYFVQSPDGGQYGEMKAQAFCWLYCWAATGMGNRNAMEEAQIAFKKIFGITFETINYRDYNEFRGEFHKWPST
jgi:hypothetical protein